MIRIAHRLVPAFVALSLAIGLACATKHADLTTTGRTGSWDSLVDRFFDAYFAFHPTAGTAAGFHQYDTQLESLTPESRKHWLNELGKLEAAVNGFDVTGLSAGLAVDRDLILDTIHAERLELERVKSWQTNPDKYSSHASETIFGLMSRNFAPEAERLKSVIARERLLPAYLQSARANLDNPPLLFTQVALDQLGGIISFFEKDVPSAFPKVTDKELRSAFHATNTAVIVALRDYQKYLQNVVLLRSRGDYRLGAETFRKKLLYEEHVDVPLKDLLRIGYDNLHANQDWFRKTAKKIDPKHTPAQILARLSENHPKADGLLKAFRDTLGGLKDFIESHHLLTIPSQVMPFVVETPPFARALTSASMDTPGPYENAATEAYFNVTLPEKSWSPKQVKEWLEGFNYGVISSTATHEAYPGHYVQFLWIKKAPSKVRKLVGCNTNAEGWAHYTEQMMLDEGFRGDDPKLRLGQLQDALLRNARYIVSIKLHTGDMTFDEAVSFFEKEGYQTHEVAVRETKRGTSDPTYLYYTLGKLEILKLRDDYRKAKGGSLADFHDAFLKEGFPPIAYLRRLLLGSQPGPVL